MTTSVSRAPQFITPFKPLTARVKMLTGRLTNDQERVCLKPFAEQQSYGSRSGQPKTAAQCGEFFAFPVTLSNQGLFAVAISFNRLFTGR